MAFVAGCDCRIEADCGEAELQVLCFLQKRQCFGPQLPAGSDARVVGDDVLAHPNKQLCHGDSKA